MSSPGDVRSPSASQTTESDISGDDDMDFELAGSTPSGISDDVEEEAGETTLYFDAEEGVLRDEDGDEVTFEDVEEGDAIEEEIEEEDAEEEEGSRTPQPGASVGAQAGQPHSITGTFTTLTILGTNTLWQSLLRCLNIIPQPRVSIVRSLIIGFAVEVTQQQILQLLSNAGMQGVFRPTTSGITTRSQARRGNAQHVALADDGEEVEDDDDDDMSTYLGYGARRRRNRRAFVGDRYPKIPSEEGGRLMASGIFGNNDRCDHSACGEPLNDATQRKRRKLYRRILDRETGSGHQTRASVLGNLASQDLIPSSKADLIVNLNARCYSGQFSEDGSFFFACGQDFKVRMYDTSNPYDWKYYKTVHYYGGQWTITDASLSPDNRNLAYSSIRSQVCLANTEQGDTSEPQMLDFSDLGRGGHGQGGGGGWGRSHGHFGIWSLRFSGDGREIVAGTSDQSVYVYDLEARRSILRIPAHGDDVNAVCFGDKMSPHILYSGSDDTTVKVWDRRSLASMRPAGMFLGHTEGVTYIDSKGDGRYVISNGKDQTCKLWDLRKMVSTDTGERINPQDYTTNFDYRFSPYDTDDHTPHPHDCSLVTFRGHRVLKTLIRCHFSPPGSTDGRYIYSGSHDGKIYVWNLDGTQAGEPINVLAATRNSRPADDERFVDRFDYYGRGGVWKTIVRDCSWHPSAPVIAATSWNGWDHGLGTCTVHSWNDGVDTDEVGGDLDGFTGAGAEHMGGASSLGATPMGARVTAQLHHDDRYYGQANSETRRSTRSRGMRSRMMNLGGLFADDAEDGVE